MKLATCCLRWLPLFECVSQRKLFHSIPLPISVSSLLSLSVLFSSGCIFRWRQIFILFNYGDFLWDFFSVSIWDLLYFEGFIEGWVNLRHGDGNLFSFVFLNIDKLLSTFFMLVQSRLRKYWQILFPKSVFIWHPSSPLNTNIHITFKERFWILR